MGDKMAERLVFRSKKAEKVYRIICSMPPLSDEDALKMVKAIQRITGRRHRVRPRRDT